MKKTVYYLILMAALSLWITPSSGQKVAFSFQSWPNNKTSVRNKVATTISDLLTEIQRAYVANRPLNLNRLNMTDEARKSLHDTWNKYGHFSVDYNEIITECLQSYNNYEVRKIYITFHRDNKEQSRELTIGFTPEDSITFVRPALEHHNFGDVVRANNQVADARERLEILNFVERFRNYYNEKNLSALKEIYSDDALIITAKVVYQKSMGDMQASLRKNVIYKKETKEEYMKKLEGIFANNKYLYIDFDSVTVLNHPSREHFYGVTLHQKWNSTNYNDDGYVFLLWQFPEDSSDPNKHPIVHVRTWQPDQIIKSGTKVLNTNDFIIPAKDTSRH